MKSKVCFARFAALFVTFQVASSLFDAGNYAIDDSCNTYIDNHSKLSVLTAAITLMQLRIENKALPDAQQGVASKHGYAAFFKTDENKAKVVEMYRKIAAGGSFQTKCFVAPFSRIIFRCAEISNAMPGCPEDGRFFAFSTSLEPNVIDICPNFFRYRRSVSRTDCPSVRRNKMTQTHLGYTQISILVHELAHLYGADEMMEYSCNVRMDERTVIFSNETYGLQASAELAADKQVINAQNYAIYADGKLPG